MAHVYTEEQNYVDIANAIREKNGTDNTYAPSEMAYAIKDIYIPKAEEVREVTIENNGLNTITPSEGYDVMKSVKLNNNIPVDGLDFSRIYDVEIANEINQYYKDAIDYSVEVTEKTKGRAIKNSEFERDGRLAYLILKDCKGFANYAFCGSSVQFADIEVTGNPNNWSVNGLFTYTPLYRVAIKGLKFIPTFTNLFYYCNALKSAYLSDWKQGSISIAQSSNLSFQSIKYIIWHAMNGANTLGYEDEGATSRTLTLEKSNAHNVTWVGIKDTTPSVEDCEMLGIDESEITKYGNLTWSQIASDVKLITITA